MLLAGIKFGVGFVLGIFLLVAAGMSFVYLVSYIRSFLDKQRGMPKVDEAEFRKVFWTRKFEYVRGEDGCIPTFSFRTLMRWDDRSGQNGRRKEPHYRY